MTSLIPTPHDSLFKTFMQDISIARNFFEVHLPAEIKSHCDFNTLRIKPTEFIGKSLRRRYVDILYSVQIKDQLGYLCLLTEHKSQPDRWAVLDIQAYTLEVIQADLKQQQDYRRKQNRSQDEIYLPIVVPLLFYHGETSPYPYSMDMIDYFRYPELARQAWGKPCKLIDLSVIPDEAIMDHPHIAFLELIQKHIRERDLLEYLKSLFVALVKDKLPDHLVVPAAQYIMQEGNCSDPTLFFDTLLRGRTSHHEEIMTIAQQWKQEGLQQGMAIAQQWKQEGLQQGMAIAQKWKQEGIQQGEATAVKHLIERRFGPIPPAYAKRIHEADAETLLLWIDRLIDAQSLEQVFQ